MLDAIEQGVALRQGGVQDFRDHAGLEIRQAQGERLAVGSLAAATGRVVNVKIVQTGRFALQTFELAEQVLFRGGLVHLRVLALHVDDDHRPAAGGRLLDQNLRGVRLARAHRAEDTDVARQHALVVALQAEQHALLSGHTSQEHVAGEAQEVGDFVVGQVMDDGAGGRAALRLLRTALHQLRLDFDFRKDARQLAMAVFPIFRLLQGKIGAGDNAPEKTAALAQRIEDVHEAITQHAQTVCRRRPHPRALIRELDPVFGDMAQRTSLRGFRLGLAVAARNNSVLTRRHSVLPSRHSILASHHARSFSTD